MAIDLLTDEQIKELQEIAEFLDSDGLSVVEKLKIFEDKVEKLANNLDIKHQEALDFVIEYVSNNLPTNGKDGRDGLDGKTPTKEELIELIKPLIPNVKNGKDGRDGVDGKSPTTEELKSIITSLIPKVENGKDGSPDTPIEIKEKLESLEDDDKLSIEAIKNLRKELDDLKNDLKKQKSNVVYSGGSSGGGRIVKSYDLSSSLNGVTQTFNLPAFWRIISVHLSSFPNILRPDIDYTSNANQMSITFTSAIEPSTSLQAGQTLIIVYAE